MNFGGSPPPLMITPPSLEEQFNSIPIGPVGSLPLLQKRKSKKNTSPGTTTPGSSVTAPGLIMDALAWLWPVKSTHITTQPSATHEAYDIATPPNTPVLAPASGTVIFSGWSKSGYGNLIVIKTPDGTTIYLAHNNQLLAPVGTAVNKGQVVSLSGSTGNSTGPHVHLEIRTPKGVPTPPQRYFVPASYGSNYPGSVPGALVPSPVPSSPPASNVVPAPAKKKKTGMHILADVTTAINDAVTPAPSTTPAPATNAAPAAGDTINFLQTPLGPVGIVKFIAVNWGVMFAGIGLAGAGLWFSLSPETRSTIIQTGEAAVGTATKAASTAAVAAA